MAYTTVVRGVTMIGHGYFLAKLLLLPMVTLHKAAV